MSGLPLAVVSDASDASTIGEWRTWQGVKTGSAQRVGAVMWMEKASAERMSWGV